MNIVNNWYSSSSLNSSSSWNTSRFRDIDIKGEDAGIFGIDINRRFKYMDLMCKNSTVAKIENVFRRGSVEIQKQELLPLMIRREHPGVGDIIEWIQGRLPEPSRPNYVNIMGFMGVDRINEWLVASKSRALSVTDCFWLKEEGSKVTWEDVRLYQHSFNRDMIKIACDGFYDLEPDNYKSLDDDIFTPELTTSGSFMKCWRRNKNGIYLIKFGSNWGIGNESRVEALCSDILDKLHVSHIRYEEMKASGKINGVRNKKVYICRCKNMTNEDIGIAPIEELICYHKTNEKQIWEWVKSQRGYYEMVIVDYLIRNIDRHTRNWGVYFDTNTGKVLRLHPLMDHNLSLKLYKSKNCLKSQVMAGESLESAAKIAKQSLNLRTDELEGWLNQASTKIRFMEVFKSAAEFNALINRIKKYKQW